jgi:signal transduction histidine kinase
MGFIETLRGPARDDAAARERFLGIMAEQADRMRRLVDDLLMLSRIEQHEHARPEAAVDVGRVLESVRDLLQFKAARARSRSSWRSSRRCRRRSATTTSSPSCSRTWSTTRSSTPSPRPR